MCFVCVCVRLFFSRCRLPNQRNSECVSGTVWINWFRMLFAWLFYECRFSVFNTNLERNQLFPIKWIVELRINANKENRKYSTWNETLNSFICAFMHINAQRADKTPKQHEKNGMKIETANDCNSKTTSIEERKRKNKVFFFDIFSSSQNRKRIYLFLENFEVIRNSVCCWKSDFVCLIFGWNKNIYQHRNSSWNIYKRSEAKKIAENEFCRSLSSTLFTKIASN